MTKNPPKEPAPVARVEGEQRPPAGYGYVNGSLVKYDMRLRTGGLASRRQTYAADELRPESITPKAAKLISGLLANLADGDGGPGYEFCWCGDPEAHTVEQGHYLHCEIAADAVRWLVPSITETDMSAEQPVSQEPKCTCGFPKDDPIHSFSTEFQSMHPFSPSISQEQQETKPKS